MQHDRRILDDLNPLLLSGHSVLIVWNRDQRSYKLIEQLGRGQTAIAWKVEDSLGRTYALKLVPKTEFKNHSLDAEARRASNLDGTRFARVDFYGDLQLDTDVSALSAFYGVIVVWIEGTSLQRFLEDPNTVVDGASFCRLAKDLCQVLQELRDCQPRLTHNDLHDENVIIYAKRDPLSNIFSHHLTVIDTGQLKSIERWDELLDNWRDQCSTLESVNNASLSPTIVRIRERIEWFSRTDQEWIVCHLCNLYNKMLKNVSRLSPSDKKFARDLPMLLCQMVDSNHSRRLDDPTQMYREVERLWRQAVEVGPPPMTTPFDLPSAELIRSDRQLMTLFSEEYPRIDACRSGSPLYIYGPRGSGKSTILRSLSIKALLASANPKDELEKISFFGVYLSSSQELRSRFWLMTESDFAALEGHVVRYFNLLLIEALVETLDCLHTTATNTAIGDDIGALGTLTTTIAHECARVIRYRLGIDASGIVYSGMSELKSLRHDIQRTRDDLWLRILDRSEPSHRPDAQLLFDVVKDLAAC
ncbi:hypothetical protein [Schlesneria sp. DSM 10557]|uniref:ORC-CDC6 family AAA ATPase n=1 Tax=Schlesneria sp. DSM 10557 TaxID=3044399 RepID=UPI00359F29E3